ncbi:MAG TPA: DUF1634 domain-containing protein [Gemmatimonadales bacterium]|nr:DUF1634 domain-containing protein [Gemmatimonadales bacterium]
MARWTDEQVGNAVGLLLRIGVIVAAVVAGAGGVVYLWRHGSVPVDYAAFRGEPQRLRSLSAILRGAAAFDPLAVTQLGVVLLIATPVARVGLSLVGFILEGDRKYQLITLLVLLILTASLVGRI